jgi:glycosyltransferase involved in cell wall biosynthesis
MVVTIGHDMQETIERRFSGKKTPDNTVINNWIDEETVYPLEKTHPKILAFKEQYGLTGKFVMMTSGNIGLYYDFENIIRVMGEFREDPSIAFVFVGDGVVKRQLINYSAEHRLENVVFVPYQDKSDLIYSLNAADVHIVTNAKGIRGVSVPSKIYGVLATNIPVLGILERGAEAWNIIEQSDCGILAEAGDYDAIRQSLGTIIKEKDTFVQAHPTGRQYLLDHFTMNQSIENYHNIIDRLLHHNANHQSL